MKQLRIFLASLLVCLTLAPSVVSAAPSKPINPPCSELSVTFAFTMFQFTSPTTAIGEGNVYHNSQPIASFRAQYFNIDQQGKGVTQLNGAHAITFLNGGKINTYDEILLQVDRNSPLATESAPLVMRANSRLYIVGGEGIYEKASGLLHTHGAFNVTTLEGGIDFSGQVCSLN